MHIHGPGGWLLAIALLLYGVSEVQSTAVQVRVQYEAFCPTCQDFVTKQLKKLVEADGVLDIVDLKLYAWGNARRFVLAVIDRSNPRHTCAGVVRSWE